MRHLPLGWRDWVANRPKFSEMLLIYGAPALLLIIAVIQIYLATTMSLSPWKGGGFGMFSTVDSPDARFLRVYLIRNQEEIPVLIPDSMSSLSLKVRTFPNLDGLRNIAEKVSQGTWIPYRILPAVEQYQSLSDGNQSDLINSPENSTETNIFLSQLYANFDALQFYRMVTEDEAELPLTERLDFQSVRVELWNYRFNVELSQLTASRLLDTSITR